MSPLVSPGICAHGWSRLLLQVIYNHQLQSSPLLRPVCVTVWPKLTNKSLDSCYAMLCYFRAAPECIMEGAGVFFGADVSVRRWHRIKFRSDWTVWSDYVAESPISTPMR